MDDKLNPFFQKLNILYGGMFFSSLVFFAAIFFLHQTGNLQMESAELGAILSYLAPLFVLGAIPAGYFAYSALCKQGAKKDNLSNKMYFYQKALLIKYALFNFAASINAVAFIFMYDKQFVLIFALISVVFLINKPSKNRFFEHLEVEN